MSDLDNVKVMMVYSRSLTGVTDSLFTPDHWSINKDDDEFIQRAAAMKAVVILDAKTYWRMNNERRSQFTAITHIVVDPEQAEDPSTSGGFHAKTVGSAVLACVFAGHKDIVILGCEPEFLKQAAPLADELVETVITSSLVNGPDIYQFELSGNSIKTSEELLEAYLRVSDTKVAAYRRHYFVNRGQDRRRFTEGPIHKDIQVQLGVELYYKMRAAAEELLREQLKAKTVAKT